MRHSLARSGKPILFSGPMVRAILDGRKTQTRRIIRGVGHDNCLTLRKRTKTRVGLSTHVMDAAEHGLLPYAVGDRLWVRESFTLTQFGKAVFRADARDADGQRWSNIAPGDPHREVRWKPSIHMPRAASRLTLVVTDVRVQRLQEIGEEDAAAEGWEKQPWRSGDPEVHHDAARDWFMDLWDSLNARRGYSWAANPWVTAITFDAHRCNIDDMEGAIA